MLNDLDNALVLRQDKGETNFGRSDPEEGSFPKGQRDILCSTINVLIKDKVQTGVVEIQGPGPSPATQHRQVTAGAVHSNGLSDSRVRSPR